MSLVGGADGLESLDKGLIYATEDYGHVDFTVPRFGDFMVRYMLYRAPRAARASKRTS